MSHRSRVTDALLDHRRHLLVAMLVLTLVVGSGVASVEQSTSLEQFQSDSPESAALDYVGEHFDAGASNTTTAQVIVRGENVLTKDALVTQLEYQQAIRGNETVDDTLTADTPTMGVANVVATTAIQQDRAAELQARQHELNETADALQASLVSLREHPNASTRAAFDRVAANTTVTLTDEDYETYARAAQQARQAENESQLTAAYRLGSQGVLADEYDALQADATALRDGAPPTLDEQLDALRDLNESEVDDVLATVLADGDDPRALRFMPAHYDPGSDTSNATIILVRQTGEEGVGSPGDAPDYIVDSQLAMQAIAADHGTTGWASEAPDDTLTFVVFGDGIVADEITASLTDSMALVGPLAMLFVLGVLLIAYRDLLDVVLGVLGILVVLLWTFGAMGWLGIAFNQMFIIVPVLLIGLSIDFGIHLVMRYREERADRDTSPTRGMRVALGSLLVALVYVTATTTIGFLANLTSPIEPIRQLGVIAAIGIVSALVVFVGFVPALKVELETWFDARGIDRRRSAIGSNGGLTGRILDLGGSAARRAPAAVLVVALLVSAGGVYGATMVDTSFDQQDFLAETPADWMQDLPDPLAPGNYSASRSITYLDDHFVRQDARVHVVVDGDVTDDQTLERVHDAREVAVDASMTATYANGDAAVQDPVSAMQRVAATNESFNATITAADTDGNGVPDRDIERVYDAFYAAAPDDAANVLHRTEDGDYEALLVTVTTGGEASDTEVTDQIRDVASVLESDSLDAIGTGNVVLNVIVQNDLFETVVRGLVVSLVVVLALLVVTYRRAEGSATLGAITVLPVAFTVAWILGTMYALDVPFTIVTGLITSLTIGLGVDYSIHVSERYVQELRATGSIEDALRRTLGGTGGALLGSAVTTAGGFGVLTASILPFLQQFGFITAVTIGYSFVASVFVLPSLLVLWTRYLAPRDIWTPDAATGPGEPTGLGDNTAPGHSPHTPLPPTAADDSPGTDRPRPTPQSDAGGRALLDPPTARGQSPSSASFGEFVPAAPVDGSVTATRRVDRAYVRPGETVTVTVELPATAGRLVVHETAAPLSVSRVDTGPAPAWVDAVVSDDAVYAAWMPTGEHDDTTPTLTYDVEIPADASDDETFTLDGVLWTAQGAAPVGGVTELTVLTDVFQRVVAHGTVTEDDLRAAHDAFANGDLTDAELRRLYQTWLTTA